MRRRQPGESQSDCQRRAVANTDTNTHAGSIAASGTCCSELVRYRCDIGRRTTCRRHRRDTRWFQRRPIDRDVQHRAYRFDGLQSSNGNVSAKAAGYQESIRGLYIDGNASLNFTLAAVPATPTFTGTWRGRATSTSCKDDGAAAGVCRVIPGVSDNLVMTLTQNGNAVSGNVDFGGYPLRATGTAQGDRLQINGTGGVNGIDYEYRNWNTTMTGSTMTGSFTFLLYQKDGGSVQYVLQLVNVTRTSTTASR